jgi:hypothetical protein
MPSLPDQISGTAAYPRTTDLEVFLSRSRGRTQAIYQYWNTKRGTRKMPARRDIDPVEMKAWLAGIQLIDVFHHPRRLVYRLVGQVDVDFRGYNPTGKTVEECAVGRSLADSLENYETVISQRSFVFDFADYKSASGLLRTQECILFPLSDDDDLVNMIMTYAEVDAIK